jgi:hypothetical protein
MSPPLLVDVGHDGSPRASWRAGVPVADKPFAPDAVLDAARISAAENRTVELLSGH